MLNQHIDLKFFVNVQPKKGLVIGKMFDTL